MIQDHEALNRLCSLYGIAPGYSDVWDVYHEVSAEAKQQFLAAMGVPAGSDADVRQALNQWEIRHWRRLLPPVQVVREPQGQPRIPVSVPTVRAEQWLSWALVLENGERHEGQLRPADLELVEQRHVGGELIHRYRFTLPFLPALGYHRFELYQREQIRERSDAMILVVAPERCFQPPALADEGRIWGPALQLYALRSQRNWGIGDFSDLKTAVELAAELGAGIVGVNPLHALFPANPEHASPYGPSSRLFLNIFYLDVEAMSDFTECAAAREIVSESRFQARLRAARARELVDYTEVAALKLPVLDALYRYFRDRHLNTNSEPGQAFRDFQAAGGEALRKQALFEALQETFQGKDSAVWGWPAWPEPYRDPNSEDVATFAQSQAERVDFYSYLQWQVELQLQAVGQRSLELGLAVGIYQDLAVSVDCGGAEAWANQGLYALEARIGAPPDEFSPTGQDWGLPPFTPERLFEMAYAPFVATLRANMRHAGALRIDHAMGLMRLYWVLSGHSAAEGAYVYYPLADLLGILALESQRNRCLVIGEDLGTVPPEVREALAASGVLSYRVLYFEKNEAGSFRAPAEYPPHALVAVSTHDLPTLNGYWRGVDLERRAELGRFPSQQVHSEQVIARAQDRARLLVALEREGLLPAGMTVDPMSAPEMTPELTQAIHVFLAQTPCKVQVFQLEDVFGQLEQVNLPGTVDECPNWRYKLSLNVENWRDDTRLQRLTEALLQERRPPELPSPERLPAVSPRIEAQIPGATYRFQFNSAFTFVQAEALVPYLQALGITHCYASPYLKARSGSTHGYDIIDHNSLNPEIGSTDDFERFADTLRRHGIGQILDMVPNHMGVMGSDNAWWLDVLENGPAAVHAAYFDIDWKPFKEEFRGKVVVPVLGDHYGVVLEQGELQLAFDPDNGTFSVFYYQHRFPIDPKEYGRILGLGIERLQTRLDPEDTRILEEYQSLITAFGNLPARNDIIPSEMEDRHRDKEIHKRHLADLCRRYPDVAWFIEENLQELNGIAGEPQSFDPLHALLEAQAYRLAYWRVAVDDINYRRFFDINDLAALRMENPQVFVETHQLVMKLITSGKVDGLRLDHPDGLYDPLQYFQRLQEHYAAEMGVAVQETDNSRPLYVVVEKILAGHERLPEQWPVHGTTGYNFANTVNGLFVDATAESAFDQIYESFIGERIDFEELLYNCKKLIIKFILAGGLNVLATQLSRIAEADRHSRDFTRNRIRSALAEVVACFPVYRTYITAEQVSEEDRRYVEWAVAVAKKRGRAADISIFNFIQQALLTDLAEGKTEPFREAVTAFAMQFQQYTSPVMAKGLEDTSFYIYNRLVSLNEVGGEPRRFSVSVPAFHHFNQESARRWPHAMLCTSTHDSKRSEDVRARISVLSECPEEWQNLLQRWSRLNAYKKRQINDSLAPSLNDEYLLYQTFLGAWPLEELDEQGYEVFCERIQSYMIKTAREAKVHTSWLNPDPDYEAAINGFVEDLLAKPDKNRFLADFLPFQERITRYGLFNSLSQTLLKLTSPGVPDIYQGTELWDFSLVDPDNRRPVDYALRENLLRALQEAGSGTVEQRVAHAYGLLESMTDGRIKLFVTGKTLTLRREWPELFREGDYTSLNVIGVKAEHVCAFARRYQDQLLMVVVPRLFLRLMGDSKYSLGTGVWGDTELEVPDPEATGRYRNFFTGETVEIEAGTEKPCLRLANIFAHFPVALLLRESENVL